MNRSSRISTSAQRATRPSTTPTSSGGCCRASRWSWRRRTTSSSSSTPRPVQAQDPTPTERNSSPRSVLSYCSSVYGTRWDPDSTYGVVAVAPHRPGHAVLRVPPEPEALRTDLPVQPASRVLRRADPREWLHCRAKVPDVRVAHPVPATGLCGLQHRRHEFCAPGECKGGCDCVYACKYCQRILCH